MKDTLFDTFHQNWSWCITGSWNREVSSMSNLPLRGGHCVEGCSRFCWRPLLDPSYFFLRLLLTAKAPKIEICFEKFSISAADMTRIIRFVALSFQMQSYKSPIEGRAHITLHTVERLKRSEIQKTKNVSQNIALWSRQQLRENQYAKLHGRATRVHPLRKHYTTALLFFLFANYKFECFPFSSWVNSY